MQADDMKPKRKWVKLNGTGLRSVNIGLRQARVPSEDPKRAGAHIYNTKQWRRLSKKMRAQKPYCAHCQRTAQQTRLVVDHVIPINQGGAGFDSLNLEVLCFACHAIKTEQDRRNCGV